MEMQGRDGKTEEKRRAAHALLANQIQYFQMQDERDALKSNSEEIYFMLH